MNRRSILQALPALPLLAPAVARAQDDWPSRPLRIVVPFPPGGQADGAARPIAAALSQALGKPAVVENRPGGSGAIGINSVLRGEPDGHSLLVTLPSVYVVPESDRLFGREPSYDAAALEPVARILADPLVMVVKADAPWRSVADFAADARARPGAIAYSSSGNYGVSHVATEMFAAAAGIRMLHVPFAGGAPALTAVLSGDVATTGVAAGTAKRHVDGGTMRILASWGDRRIPALPDVPTFREAGFPDVLLLVWATLFAPRGVPAARIARLRTAVAAAMRDPAVTGPFERAGSVPAFLDGPDLVRFLAEDSARLIAATRRIGRVE
jgi:tripartite-type tricarboxylate transporter receptor subunit TctC